METNQNMPFKVGDRVEYWGMSGWKPGRILGRDALNQWIVKLDGDVPYKNIRVKESDVAERLRHSTAPTPEPKSRQRRGYMPEGELERQLEAAKQFKLGDHIALMALTHDHETNGTIVAMDSKSFLFQPDGSVNRIGYYLNALAFARKLDAPDQTPDVDPDPELTVAIMHDFNAGLPGFEVVSPKSVSVTDYKPKIGDQFWAGEEIVRIIDINSEQVLLERQFGIPIKCSIQYIRNSVNKGLWTVANKADRIAYLTKEADRLDTVAAQAIEDRAAVMVELARLKAAQE